jgi:hypothetical protein
MTYEDFTTYTEVDPNSHLSKTAYHVDHTGYRNEDCYLYKDKGVDHFGDFTHLVDSKPNSAGTTNYAHEYFWMLSNDVDDAYGLNTAGKTAIAACWIDTATSGQCNLFLREFYGGTAYSVSSPVINYGTQFYFTIVKSGTSLVLHAYSNSARTQELAWSPLSLTLHADHKFRYIFAGNVWNDGTDSGKWIFVYIDNLDLQEGGVLKEVTDSLSLSDAVLRDKTLTISDSVASLDSLLSNKTLQITDTVTLLETILCDKTFTVSDSIGLSELITVITGGILKEVLDAIGLCEEVKIDKSLIIQDTVSLLDQIFRHKPNVSITDAIALAEVIAVSKLFAVTDAVSIADVVYAMKTLPIYDQITVTDQVSTPTRILQALDAIGLSDTAYVNKTLIITDQISLVEVVEKGVAGAVKTKIFLLIGDLAVQLSG